jgi:hypothetical protein
MIRNSMRIEPEHVHPDHRFAPRHIRPVHLSGGFFTLGFALAVLAGSALFAGASGALNVAEPASASTPGGAVVERAQPVDHLKAEGARSVVISEAPTDSPNNARNAAKPLQ